MPIAGAAVAAGGSLIGGNQAAGAAQDAASAGAQGGRDAINAGLAVYNQNRSDNYNGMIVGNSALNRIADMYGLDYFNGVPSLQGIQATGGETTTDKPSFLQRLHDPGGLIWQQESSTTPMQFTSGGTTAGGSGSTSSGTGYGTTTAGGGQGEIVKGDGEADFSSFYQTPDYLVRMREGEGAIDRRAAALGSYRSGGTDADHMRFASDLGAQGFGGYLNTLFNLAGHGSNSTGQVNAAGGQFGSQSSSALQNMGNARASGYLGAGAARQDAWNGVGSALGNLWGERGTGGNYENTGWGG